MMTTIRTLEDVVVEPQRAFLVPKWRTDIRSRWMHLYKLVRTPPEQLVLAELRIYYNPLYQTESLHPLNWCARVSLFEPPDKPYIYSVYDIATKPLARWIHMLRKYYLPRANAPLLYYRNQTDLCLFLQDRIRGYRCYTTDTERYYTVYLTAGEHDRWVTETTVLTVPNYPETIEAFERFLDGRSNQHLFYETSPPLTELLRHLESALSDGTAGSDHSPSVVTVIPAADNPHDGRSSPRYTEQS